MNILIIEDELKTAKALQQVILSVSPDTKILASIQTIKTAIKFLAENERPDVIFMDIQLADGLCFEIFHLVKVESPVIFCTAYDEYALDAFKSNGIDYILKPFSLESVKSALGKILTLKNFFQTPYPAIKEIEALISRAASGGKKGFLVFKNKKYVTVKTEQIAFFYIRNEMPMMVTFDQQEFPSSQSLDDIHAQLPQDQFYRVTRQYLISYSAVQEVEQYFGRKLFIRLTIPTTEKILLGKDKATQFLTWLQNH